LKLAPAAQLRRVPLGRKKGRIWLRNGRAGSTRSALMRGVSPKPNVPMERIDPDSDGQT
jgi:hypothetical protein